jgi:hypothetical protein
MGMRTNYSFALISLLLRGSLAYAGLGLVTAAPVARNAVARV